MINLAGKHALITGGLGCIGQAMAQVFIAAGARVTCLDRPNRKSYRKEHIGWALI
jgi:NAD(P)-dependent dehydrogenase (short-subunit alcohol dehydrogenase family)